MDRFKKIFGRKAHAESSINPSKSTQSSELQPQLNFGPNGNAILVIDASGTDESTFVSLVTGEKVGGDHILGPCTPTAGDDQNVYLINVPAFGAYAVDTTNDTNKSDTDVLREIVGYLGFLHKRGIILSGMIYLHRMTDHGAKNTASKNLKMLEVLCSGHQNIRNGVVFATSCWNEVDSTHGAEIEGEFKELIRKRNFWGGGKQNDIETFRYDDTKEAGLAIVNSLLSKNLSVVLEVQQRMIVQGGMLHETGVGCQVQENIMKIRDKLVQRIIDAEIEIKKELGRSRTTGRRAVVGEARKLLRSLEANREKFRIDGARLQVDMETLIQETEQHL